MSICRLFVPHPGNERKYCSAATSAAPASPTRFPAAAYEKRYPSDNTSYTAATAADLVASKFTLPAMPQRPRSPQQLNDIGYRLGESYAAKQARTSPTRTSQSRTSQWRTQPVFGGEAFDSNQSESAFDQFDGPEPVAPARYVFNSIVLCT